MRGKAFVLAFLTFTMLFTVPFALNNNLSSTIPLTSATFPSPPLSLQSDGASSWWNNSYRYRVMINISEPGISNRNNEPIDLWINFSALAENDESNCGNNSIRVLEYSGTNWNELPSQVWNVTYGIGSNISSATITFQVDIAQGETKSYYLYYNETAQPPTYTTLLSNSFDSVTQKATIDNNQYIIRVAKNSGIYDLIYDTGTVRDYHLNESLSPLGPTYNYHYGSNEFYVHSTEWIEICAFDNNTSVKVLDATGSVVNSTNLDQYEFWRVPSSGVLGAGLYEVTSNNPVSIVVTSVAPTNVDDDEVWAAYATKILGRINAHLWISAYEDNTQIQVYDTTNQLSVLNLTLDSREHYYYRTNSSYDQYEIYLISANHPVSIIAGYLYEGSTSNYRGAFTGVYGKDQKYFTFPSFEAIRFIATEDNTIIDFNDGRGHSGTVTLNAGQSYEPSNGADTFPTSTQWASINASKPIRVFTRYFGNTGTAVAKENPVDTLFYMCDPGGGDIKITGTEDGTTVYFGAKIISLNRGQTSTQAISNTGVKITADKPVFVEYFDDDGSPDHTAMYIPQETQPPRIASVELEEAGPIFVKYKLEWEALGGMNTTDYLTIYSDYELFRLERNVWFTAAYPNRTFRLIDTYYNGDLFDEYVYDDILVTSLDNPTFLAENYTVIHDIFDNNLMTLGLFLTDYSGNGQVNISHISLSADYRDGIVHITSSNQTVIERPENPTASDFAQITLWELAKDDINPDPDVYAINDKLHNSLQVAGIGNVESIFFNLILTLKDIDGIPAYNLTVFVNRTDSVFPTNYTGYSDTAGQVVFPRLQAGKYSVNITYTDIDFGKTLSLAYLDEIDLNSTLSREVTNLQVTHFDISFISYPDGDTLDGATVTFYNNTGTQYDLLGTKTATNGFISLYWANTTGNVWQYTFNLSFYGADRLIRLQPTTLDDGDFDNITCIVFNGTILSGNNDSLLLDDDDFLMLTNNTDGQIDATCLWKNVATNNLVEMVVNLRGNLSDTQALGVAWIYNWSSASWVKLFNFNGSTTETLYFRSFNSSLSGLISGGNVLLGLNCSHTIAYQLTLNEIDLDLLYSTGSWDYNYNFTLASYTTGTIEAALEDFSTTLINLTAKSQTLAYGQDLTFKVRYNYSLPGSPDQGISSATFFKQLYYDGHIVDTSSLAFTEEVGQPGNYSLFINGTDNTLNLVADETYIFYVEASKAGFETKSYVFTFYLQAISTNISVTANASVYWGQNLTILVNYNEFQGTGIPNATITYNWAGNTGTFSMDATNLSNIFYYTTINTSITFYGHQIIEISASKINYEPQTAILTFNLLERQTKLNNSDTIFLDYNLYALESHLISFNYTDVLSGTLIHNATATYTWYNASNPTIGGSGTLTESNGYYILDFDTENRPVGVYIIGIVIKKLNYSQPTMTLRLNINPRPATLAVPALLYSIERTNDLELTVNLTDDRLATPLDNFLITYSIYLGSTLLFSNQTSTSSNGVYRINLLMSSYGVGSYRIHFTVTQTNYSITTQDITIAITYLKIAGLEEPVFYTLLVAIIAFVAVVLGYTIVKHQRIPVVIKKIDATVKIIEKSKKEASIPVLKSKNELYQQFFKTNFGVLGLQPPELSKAVALKESPHN
ncbi:MAG: hypothetical protein ACTSRS_03470 [Candidatus Helarchaeota archaeon]